MSADRKGDLARLRATVLAPPGTAGKVSHGRPVFLIDGGGLFRQLRHDHHRDGGTAVMVQTAGVEEATTMIEAEPELLHRPAHIGAAGRIAIRMGAPEADRDHVADMVAASWRREARRTLPGDRP